MATPTSPVLTKVVDLKSAYTTATLQTHQTNPLNAYLRIMSASTCDAEQGGYAPAESVQIYGRESLMALRDALNEAFPPAPAGHVLYKDGDSYIPESIKDRNGQVVLGLCKKCGKGEADLAGPCE